VYTLFKCQNSRLILYLLAIALIAMKTLILLLSVILLTGVACKKTGGLPTEKPVQKVQFTNIVILGNSILWSPANPSAGWNGSWGMAASAAEKDYVHLLTRQFKNVNPAAVVNIQNIAQFEREYSTYNLDDNLKALKDSKPDLLILRIGENVAADFNSAEFEKRYLALINYFKANNTQLKVFAAGSVWSGKDAVDAIMKKHSPFIPLSSLAKDDSNYAYGMFPDSGVSAHPGDKGMQTIANLMWEAILQLD
jgi:lysophospholipase L1-like esterase